MSDASIPSPAEWFVLRTPLLPLAWTRGWSEGARARDALEREGELEAAVESDLAHARGMIGRALALPEVREALYVASPVLHAEVDRWLEGRITGKEAARVELSLARYLLRMSSRSTPFGLFAGGIVGEVADTTALAVPPLAGARRHVRLDSAYVGALARYFGEKDEVLRGLRYLPNPTLYRVGEELRYYEPVSDPAGGRRTVLSRAAFTPELQRVLARAAEGAGLDALAACAAGEEFPVEEGREYVLELVRNQLLVSSLIPSAAGPDAAAQLLAALPAPVRETSPEARALEEALRLLDELNDHPLGAPAEAYERVARTLAAIPVGWEQQPLWNVELVRAGPPPRLSRDAAEALARAARAVQRLNAPIDEDPLADFRRAFVARFEREEVPLLVALDDEAGVGFGANASWAGEPLLRTFFAAGQADRVMCSRAHARLLARLLHEGVEAGEAVLTPADLDSLPQGGYGQDPASFSVLGTVFRAPGGEERLLFRNFRGPTAAKFFGRFCHADPALAGRVDAMLRREAEARPGAIHAELGHLPEGRTGNVFTRPLLGEWEITVTAAGVAAPDRRIPVNDLTVTVRDGGIVLRSRSLGRRVIPRISSMGVLSSSRHVPLVRFLDLVEGEAGRTSDLLLWGGLGDAPYLPRVVFGRVVISRARWQIPVPDDLRRASTPAARFQAVAGLRRRLRLPRFVHLANFDQELTLDLDVPMCTEVLAAALRSRGEAILVEAPGEDAAAAAGADGDFANEVVVVCPDVLPHAERAARGSLPAVPRRFSPGSEWLFAKLYAGPETADRVLREVAAPLARWAREEGAVDRWFFIRYSDPRYHLRVRLRGEPRFLAGELLPRLHAALGPLLASGEVAALETATYVREVERYGGPEAISLAEQVFQADSECVAAALQALAASDRLDARWELGLRSIHLLLDDFGFAPAERLDLVRSWRAEQAAALQGRYLSLRSHLSAAYRAHRGRVGELLAGPDEDPDMARALAERSHRVAPLAHAFRELDAAGRLATPLSSVVGSLSHMTVNRVFVNVPNENELVLYELLTRHYTEVVARSGTRVAPAGR